MFVTIVHSLILQLFIEAVTQVVEGVSNICTIIKRKAHDIYLGPWNYAKNDIVNWIQNLVIIYQ